MWGGTVLMHCIRMNTKKHGHLHYNQIKSTNAQRMSVELVPEVILRWRRWYRFVENQRHKSISSTPSHRVTDGTN